jgi:hypothetical protein
MTDKNGKRLEPGQTVTLTCKVIQAPEGSKYVTVATESDQKAKGQWMVVLAEDCVVQGV